MYVMLVFVTSWLEEELPVIVSMDSQEITVRLTSITVIRHRVEMVVHALKSPLVSPALVSMAGLTASAGLVSSQLKYNGYIECQYYNC